MHTYVDKHTQTNTQMCSSNFNLTPMIAMNLKALASERELATALFSPDTNVGSTSRRFSRDSERSHEKPDTDLGFVLDRVFEGVCRPFKVRVEQVLQSQPGLLLSYKLSHLLEFYRYTVSDLLGPGAALSVTLRDVAAAAEKTFFDILKARGDKLLRYHCSVPVDLSPPPAVAEGISALLELLNTYSGMMVPAGEKKPDFQPVISAMLDPIIQACLKAVLRLSTCPKFQALYDADQMSWFDSDV